MTESWKLVSVEELASSKPSALATGPFGSRISAKYFVSEGVPVIRGSNLSDNTGKRLNENRLTYLTEEKAKEFERSTVIEGDLIFTCWGTINQVGFIDGRCSYPKYVVSNKQMKLTPNTSKVDPLFLYYAFSGPELQHKIKAMSIGSSVPGFNLGQLRKIKIRIPPLEQQRAIANTLGVLDDKIELNHQMNNTLKKLAQALFKSWFLDFDPVVAKSAGKKPIRMNDKIASMFPDKFVESELGPIPNGWMVSPNNMILSVEKIGIKPKDYLEETFYHYSIPAFDKFNYPAIETGKEIGSNKYIVQEKCVLISKLNPEIKRVWLPVRSNRYRGICSTEFLICSPQQSFTQSYLYFYLSDEQFIIDFISLVTGTSKSHQRVKPTDFLKMKTVIPNNKILAAFNKFASPIIDHILQNTEESITLAKIRDLLLPNLLSGELKTKQGEKIVSEAI